MGIQGGIDFFLHRGGSGHLHRHDHGVEVVGIGAVFPALGGSQLNLGHGRIICGWLRRIFVSLRK
jgi:hypothetical protein